MSLEQSIANFTSQAGQLLDLPGSISQEALAKIAQMNAAYQNIIATQVTSFYVNQATGLDTNAGTVAAPFKTISKAISLTPRGGYCNIILSADYLVSNTEVISGRRVFITSASSAKHRLTFNVRQSAINPAYREVCGFGAGGGDSIWLVGITVCWPELPPALAPLLHDQTAIFSMGYAGHGFLDISLFGCDLIIPNTPASAMVQMIGCVSLQVLGCQFTGAQLNGNGKWVDAFTSSAGTSSTAVSSVLTNLAVI